MLLDVMLITFSRAAVVYHRLRVLNREAMKKIRVLLPFVIIYALLSGCAHIPAIPPPDRPVADKAPPVEASVINIPVTMQLAPAAAVVDKAVPRAENHDRGDKDWIIISNIEGDVGYRYYWERTPITLNMNGGAITASTEVRYRQRGGLRSFFGWKSVCCGCGADWPRVMKLGLKTTLDINDDWRVEPHTVEVPMQSMVGCALTELAFATNRITGVARDLLKDTAAGVNEYLRTELDPKAKAQSAWRAMQDPIPMPGGESLFFYPEALRIGPLNGSGDRLAFSIGLVARPRIVKGGVTAMKARPLPGLSGTIPPEDGDFHVALEEEVPFDLAANKLFGALKDRSYVIGDKPVHIEKVRLYGSGDSAVIEAELMVKVHWGPPLRTKVYLAGEPAYDDAARTIFIKRLDYTPETKSVLAKAASWLLDERLRKDFAGHARWYIGDRLDARRSGFERALNRDLDPHVRLNFSLSAMRPLSVGMTSTALRAVFMSDGRAELAVR